MIRGLIFDFDGLIVDTELPAFQSWQELFAEHGGELSLAEWADCLGGPSGAFDGPACLEAQLGRRLDRAALLARRRQRKTALVAEQRALPGVEGYLAEAHVRGLRVGLASSSPRAWIEEHLHRLRLEEYFECIRCAEDVAHVKPAPDLYRAVLTALALRPEEALVLEDSPNGILAAKQAGIYCVVVPNALTSQLCLDQADLCLSSLADLPLAVLLDQAGRHSERLLLHEAQPAARS